MEKKDATRNERRLLPLAARCQAASGRNSLRHVRVGDDALAAVRGRVVRIVGPIVVRQGLGRLDDLDRWLTGGLGLLLVLLLTAGRAGGTVVGLIHDWLLADGKSTHRVDDVPQYCLQVARRPLLRFVKGRCRASFAVSPVSASESRAEHLPKKIKWLFHPAALLCSITLDSFRKLTN